tara:strand:+ start:411 stop:680 length:270 start_codon:yes stop_codon:yes gene_type:complete
MSKSKAGIEHTQESIPLKNYENDPGWHAHQNCQICPAKEGSLSLDFVMLLEKLIKLDCPNQISETVELIKKFENDLAIVTQAVELINLS